MQVKQQFSNKVYSNVCIFNSDIGRTTIVLCCTRYCCSRFFLTSYISINSRCSSISALNCSIYNFIQLSGCYSLSRILAFFDVTLLIRAGLIPTGTIAPNLAPRWSYLLYRLFKYNKCVSTNDCSSFNCLCISIWFCTLVHISDWA